MKKFVVVALAFAAVPATFAASLGSSAAFTTLSYRLIDLDPHDGVAASVALDFEPDDLLVKALLFNTRGGFLDGEAGYGSTLGRANAATAGAGASASGHIVGWPNFEAMTTGALTTGGYSSYAGVGLNVMVGAKTAIEWTGNYVVSAWTTGEKNVKSKSFASVVFGSEENTFTTMAYTRDGASVISRTGVATFRLDNFSNANSWQSASFMATTTGGQVTPIPEPSSWLMGLAGIGGLGGVVRRRASKQERGRPS